MKHTLKKTSDTLVSITTSVSEADLKKAKSAALTQLSTQVKVPGFRTGKVPPAIAEKNLDPNLLANETMEQALNAALNDCIVAEDLRVLDQPKVNVTKFVPYTDLEFTADIEVLPPVKLADYKKLKARKEKFTVDAKEVDEVIDRIRTNFAERAEVTRAAKSGDEVVIDFDGRDKKNGPIDGTKAEDYALALGSGSFIPGFEDKLIGHKAGEQFDIDVTFPADYHAKHLQKAKVTFAINLKKIQEVVLPKADDDLAKKSGPFNSIKDLKADIKRELTAQKERSATEKLKDDLLGELAEKTKLTLPAVLVEDQLRALEQEFQQNLLYRGQTLEQYMEGAGYKDRDIWIEKELRPAAERRVKAGLVLAELSKVESIDISTDEFEAELARRKAEAPKMADQLDTPEARRDLANRVITEKTIQRLVEFNQK